MMITHKKEKWKIEEMATTAMTTMRKKKNKMKQLYVEKQHAMTVTSM